MKRLVLFVLILVFSSKLIAQENWVCGTASLAPEWALSIKGGLYMPNAGTVNALFIFAQFPDDNYDNSNANWPKNAPPSEYIRSLVDSMVSQNSSNGGLTHYFRDMSNGQFKLIGKSISVTTPNSRQYYLDSGKRRIDINKEILRKVDLDHSFEEFDNWRKDSPFNFTNTPDGIVDMVFIIYRNISSEYPTDNDKSIISNRLG